MDELQKAIKWLEEMEKQNILWEQIFYLKKPESSEYGDNAANCRALLNALRQMKPSGWIPVSERLPEEKDASANNKILVLFDNGFVDIWNYLLFVYHVTSNAEFDLAQITHWMPLPQPPESEARV